jgi:hypothetical protein
MPSARQRLLGLIDMPDSAYDQSAAALRELRLQAAQELFEQRRSQIPLLGKLAEDAGIARIRSLADLVPLLFAHTVYKSYPQSFVDQGRWDRMLEWLGTLSVADLSNVDVAGVADVDDWLERLWDAGHAVIATSGSSGKCSFLNQTMADRANKTRHLRQTVGWPFVQAGERRPFFWLGPLKGRNSAIESALSNAENWGRPDAIYSLTEQPLRIADVSRMAALRTRMANGSATPGEISAMNAGAAEQGARMRAEVNRVADTILAHRHEPVFLSGLWSQHMLIIQRARELGVGDGEFHPQTLLGAGGGIKGVALPDDYKEQVSRFYGGVVRFGAYGMTEMAQILPRCEADRYHAAPGLIMLPLNENGDRLLTGEDGHGGVVEARFAFLDLLYEGRWGGLITGDKVTVDFAERCPCGRHGPTLLDNITRYAQTGQDDHIGCAGTIDAYIRGEVNA